MINHEVTRPLLFLSRHAAEKDDHISNERCKGLCTFAASGGTPSHARKRVGSSVGHLSAPARGTKRRPWARCCGCGTPRDIDPDLGLETGSEQRNPGLLAGAPAADRAKGGSCQR
ncbi:hypothetical protein MRX96_014387 [Rhipicephalus microplus]